MNRGMAEEEEAFIRYCLERIWDGEVHSVALTDLAPRVCQLGDQRLRQILANIVQPRFSALRFKRPSGTMQSQEALATWCMDQWELFHTAATVLADLTCSEPWGGKFLGAAITAASARVLVATVGADALPILQERQLEMVARCRSDPDGFDITSLRNMQMTISLLAEVAAQDMRKLYVEGLTSQCQDFSHANAETSTRALSLGGPPDAWVARMSHCCEVEAALDEIHQGEAWSQAFAARGRLTAIMVAEWMRCSLNILPWILAWILAPQVIQQLMVGDSSSHHCSDLQVLRSLRSVLEHSGDAEMLRRLYDSLLSALTLLLQLSRVEPCMTARAFVDWCVAILTVAHSAGKLLLRGLPSATIASALASRIADFCKGSVGEFSHPPLPPPMLDAGESFGSAGRHFDPSRLDIKRLSSRVFQVLRNRSASGDDSGPPTLDSIADSLASCVHREVHEIVSDGSSHGDEELGGWPKQLSSMLLLFHLLPDVSAAPLLAQCRLAALRALGPVMARTSDIGTIGNRLLSFFRQECGHTNPTLRHLAEVCQDASGRGVLTDGKCSAVVCSSLAASHLGLSALTETLSLSAAVPDLFKASTSLMSTRGWWTGQSVKQHRRLSWRPLLSSATIIWHSSSGDIEIDCSELQAHILLAFSQHCQIPAVNIYAAAQAWENREGDDVIHHWKTALDALCESDGPLQLREDSIVGVKIKPPPCKWKRYDLAILLRPSNGWTSSSTSELSPDGVAGGREASARAPLVDAAVMRLLKRWHILTVDELLLKMASFPVSLEISQNGESVNSSAFAAVHKAAANVIEVHARAIALADRGYLEVQINGKKDTSAAVGIEIAPPAPGTCYVYME